MDLDAVRSRAWAWYLAAAVFIGQYYVVSAYGATASDTLYLVLGGSAVVAAIVGLAVVRPKPIGAWIVVTASIVAYLAGDAVLAGLEEENAIVPFPSLADWLYLGVYPALIVAFAVIRRSVAPGRDRAATVDSLIVGFATLGVLGPLYLIDLWNSPFFDSGQRWVAVAYPVADAALLAVGARLVLAAGRRVNGLTLLGAAAAAIVVGNAAYNAQALNFDVADGGVASVGWLAFTCLLGGAVLVPPTRNAERGPAWPDGIRVVGAVAVVAAYLRWGDADSRVLSAVCLGAIVVLGALRGRPADGSDDEAGADADRRRLHPADTDFVDDLPIVPLDQDATPARGAGEPVITSAGR